MRGMLCVWTLAPTVENRGALSAEAAVNRSAPLAHLKGPKGGSTWLEGGSRRPERISNLGNFSVLKSMPSDVVFASSPPSIWAGCVLPTSILKANWIQLRRIQVQRILQQIQ